MIAACLSCNNLCETYESHSRIFGTTKLSKCCRYQVAIVDLQGFDPRIGSVGTELTRKHLIAALRR